MPSPPQPPGGGARSVYLDHNAQTPLRPSVARLLVESAERDAGEAGNPSSVHAAGRAARARMTEARTQIAAALGAGTREVLFTASGTEANAWALRGAFLARPRPERRRIVASAIEHPSVLFTLTTLERDHGAEVVLVPPEATGRVDPARVGAALTESTALCSLQWANNETGVLQPVEEVAALCRSREVPLHVDAVQAAGKVPVDLDQLPAALVSISSHKVGGPAGMGALISRIPIAPLIPGHQESGLRGGTPNVAACEAFALALHLAQEELAQVQPRLARLRDDLEARLAGFFPAVRVHGTAPRVANTSNLGFPGLDAETLLIALDLDGLYVSTGAACASGSLSPSHVLLAMGLSRQEARSALRVSLGHSTEPGDVEALLAALQRHLPR